MEEPDGLVQYRQSHHTRAVERPLALTPIADSLHSGPGTDQELTDKDPCRDCPPSDGLRGDYGHLPLCPPQYLGTARHALQRQSVHFLRAPQLALAHLCRSAVRYIHSAATEMVRIPFQIRRVGFGVRPSELGARGRGSRKEIMVKTVGNQYRAY